MATTRSSGNCSCSARRSTSPTSAGATALMIAARNGDLGMLQFLLSRGADPSAAGQRRGRPRSSGPSASPETGKQSCGFCSIAACRRDAPRPAAPHAVASGAASLRALDAALARIPPASPVRCGRPSAARPPRCRSCARCRQAGRQSPRKTTASISPANVSALEAALRAGDARDARRDGAVGRGRSRDQARTLHHERREAGRSGRPSGCARCRGARRVKSWQVFYMPKVLEAAENASPDLFPQLSSPTEEALVPGTIRHVGARPGHLDGSASGPSSRSAKGRRSCSWSCPSRRAPQR